MHVKRSNCPAGDYNCYKGKEDYPTLAFEAITDHNRWIMGILSVQFGTPNDKHIVRLDAAVAKKVTVGKRQLHEIFRIPTAN